MKDFVPYEQALALKELGFDKLCFGLYSIMEHDDIEIGDFYFGPSYATKATEGRSILAPTFSQAFRWFRDKYKYFTSPTQYDDDVIKKYDWVITKNLGNGKILIYFVGYHNSYEEAESACIDKLIELATITK